jgi:CHAT domain-containing protein
VETIAALFGRKAVAWLGPEATEDRATALVKGPRFVHFACHALLDRRAPLESGLALTDGLLQAWEVFERIRLDADLVTLSGCETGLGADAAGEGLLGLTRAFQLAGARSVLASLWNVSDRSTSRLMARFYGELRNGVPRDEALRRAQLELLHGEFRAPFHWAAFALFGDAR